MPRKTKVSEVKEENKDSVVESNEVENLEEVASEKVEETPQDVKDEKSNGKSEKPNAVIVFNKNNNEIRRYTLELHGKNFKELATQLVDKKGFTMKLVTLRPSIVCPSCGAKIERY